MALLDVNALVALAWDSHVHHAAMRGWFRRSRDIGWATCPITESGFVRVSSNPKVLPAPVTAEAARAVLISLRRSGAHRFLANDVSLTDADVAPLAGHAQVTDTVLTTLARRNGVRLVTFDAGLARRAEAGTVELLGA